jgi:nitrite reductase/ring-hydroxylating ferredoxin subunit
MSWLSERMTKLMLERGLSLQTLADAVAVERSHLNLITAGARTPTEELTRSLAAYFDEDPELWVRLTFGKPEWAIEVKPVLPVGFFKVADLEDLPPGEMLVVANGYAAVANLDGELYAFDNICPHARGSLGHGWLYDGSVVCPSHAGRWDVRTGEALTSISTQDIAVYPVRVRDGAIEVKLQDASA